MRDYKIGDVVEIYKISDFLTRKIGEIGIVSETSKENSLLMIDRVQVKDNLDDRFFKVFLKKDVRPKYWAVKRPIDYRTNPLWQRLIKYLHKYYKWAGDANLHYGFDGNDEYDKFHGSRRGDISSFKNNAFELTLEEWINFNYDNLSLPITNSYTETSVYTESKSKTNMEKVLIKRRDLIALIGRSKLGGCSECKQVIEHYLDLAKYSTDDSTWPIEQHHLDMIPRLSSEQRKIVAEYIKLPEARTYKMGDTFSTTDGETVMITKAGLSPMFQLTWLDKFPGNTNGAVRVENGSRITEEELKAMARSEYYKLIKP